MTPTRVVDRVSASLPYSYFSLRLGMLLLTLASLIGWAITGFNIAEGAVPIVSIQYSTLATFAFFFYVLVVNLQLGGLEKISQLGSEMKFDLLYLIRRSRKSYRQGYKNTGTVDGLRAGIYAFLVCLSALFAFELIWVPLYDYFQFGSFWWPVYYAHTPGLFSSIVYRNVLMFLIPLLLASMIMYAFGVKSLDAKGNPSYRWSLTARINSKAVGLFIAAEICWAFWIQFPHNPIVPATFIGLSHPTFEECLINPSQTLFPQNTYTVYPCSASGAVYPLSQIFGFFDPNPWTHAINVLTKFATFAAFCFPFMVKVKRT